MKIRRSDVERVSELARLELSPEELESLTHDLQQILEHFDALRDLDLSDVAPVGAAERPAPLREDRVDTDPLKGPLEAIAPDWREGFFVLPRLPALDVDLAEETAPPDDHSS